MRPRGGRVHAGSLSSLWYALRIVGFIRGRWVHWGAPGGGRVHQGSWVHWCATCGRRDDQGSLGSFGCTLGDFGCIRGRSVHLGAESWSWCSFWVSRFIVVGPGINWLSWGHWVH